MNQRKWHALAVLGLFASPSFAGGLSFSDPQGDDKGPGAYVYPTDAVYKKGSFDLTGLSVSDKGSDVEFEVSIAVPFEDPWDSAKWPQPGNGFSLQMFQIYIDADGAPGSGEKSALPGMNAEFAENARWEKVVVLSPQHNKVVLSEVKQKAAALEARVVLPRKVTVKGKTLSARVAKKDLGIDKLEQAGFQVVVASNEGYPKGNDILSRKVNEFEGQHRFGGGSDGDEDPHFVDCLSANAKGSPEEVAAQQAMMAFDAGKGQKATLQMVRR